MTTVLSNEIHLPLVSKGRGGSTKVSNIAEESKKRKNEQRFHSWVIRMSLVRFGRRVLRDERVGGRSHMVNIEKCGKEVGKKSP